MRHLETRLVSLAVGIPGHPFALGSESAFVGPPVLLGAMLQDLRVHLGHQLGGASEIRDFFYPQIITGGLEHEWIMTFHSVGNVIIPTDELHHFSEGWVYHQPDQMGCDGSQKFAFNTPPTWGYWPVLAPWSTLALNEPSNAADRLFILFLMTLRRPSQPAEMALPCLALTQPTAGAYVVGLLLLQLVLGGLNFLLFVGTVVGRPMM